MSTSKQSKNHFTTGEFASLFGINKQTLFYYDRIGIFSPEYVAENGYRYYSYTQIETLETLLMFKELNVPLAKIRELASGRSPEAFISILEEQRSVLDRKLTELKRSQRFLEEKIRITEEGIEAPIDEVLTRKLPARQLLITEYSGPGDELDISRAVGEHFTRYRGVSMAGATGVGAIIPVSSITEEGYSYSHFYSNKNGPIPKGSVTGKRHEGDYLVIYDDHGYRRILEMSGKLLRYAADKGIELEDRIFEDLILDDLSVDGYYHYLVRLAVKIK